MAKTSKKLALTKAPKEAKSAAKKLNFLKTEPKALETPTSKHGKKSVLNQTLLWPFPRGSRPK